jgi:regulator of G protein signaling-like protein
MAVITRAEWTKIRDRHGVKAGNSSVSIGKTLDAYHAAKTCDQRITKAKDLLNAYAKYSSDLDVKIPGQQQLAREIGGLYIKEAKDALEKYEDLKKFAKKAQDLSMDLLLKSKRLMAIFTPYAKKTMVDESLDFIRAVDKRAKKQEIYEKYVKEHAPRWINVPGAIRDKLDELAKDEQYDKMDFVPARKSIAAMMEADVLPRFIQTKEFKEALNEMAGLDE